MQNIALGLQNVLVFDIAHHFLALSSVFFAVNLALPIAKPQRLIHFFLTKNQTLLHRASNMERLSACTDVALDALSFTFVANRAPHVELIKVELSAIHFEFGVFSFEPYIRNPINAGDVHPFFSFQINHSPLNIRTQHAGWQWWYFFLRRLIHLLQEKFTTGTEPG